jgi:hypothetical protein
MLSPFFSWVILWRKRVHPQVAFLVAAQYAQLNTEYAATALFSDKYHFV